MSATNTCFEDVIGLSRTDCECYGMPPADFDVSASGLYLDETPGMNLKKVFAVAECSDDGWDILTRARTEGTKSFMDMVIRGVRANTKDKRPIGRTVIGKELKTSTVKLLNTYHGLDVRFHWVRGGTVVIKRIGGAFKFNGSVTVDVYDEWNETPLYTRTITAVQNKPWWTDIEPITIDLSNLNGDHPRLWFLFTPTGGQEALHSSIAPCACGGKAKWTHHMGTCAAGIVVDGNAWTAWAVAGGVKGNTLSGREDWTHQNETQGLMLDVDFRCDGRSVLCSGEPDYQQDPVQMAFAVGARYSSALYVIEYVTGSTRVIREAIVGGDEMELLRVSYRKEMQEVADYLVEVLSEGADHGSRSGVNLYSDCFICKEESGFRVERIQR